MKASFFWVAWPLLVGGALPLAADEATLLVSGGTYIETGVTYTAEAPDTSGVVALEGASVLLSEPRIRVHGSGSGVRAEGGSTVTLVGGTLQTLGTQHGAVTSSEGSRVDLSGVGIVTTGEGAPGLMTLSGGEILSKDASIVTEGADSPGLVVGAEGGAITLIGGTLRSSGPGSPGLVSAGEVQVTGGIFLASGSPAAVVIGPHSLTLKDTVLLGGQLYGVDVGSGRFRMTGGSLTALVGPLFYAAGAPSSVDLKQVSLVQQSGDVVIVGDGAELTLNADSQVLKGDLAVGALGTLRLNLSNGSDWEGASDQGRAAGAVDLSFDGTSVWTVTADSWVSTLTVESATIASLYHSLVSGGHTIWYKSSANGWLAGRTLSLDEGGLLKPY